MSTRSEAPAFLLHFLNALNHFCEKQGRGVDSQLARACNVSPAFIGKLRKGRSGGSEKTRREIAKFFGYEYHDFINFGEQIEVKRRASEKAKTDNSVSQNDINAALLATLKSINEKLDGLSQLQEIGSKIDLLLRENMQEDKKKSS
jgi:transcriptional regulator with XRE-family HTH domain